MNKKFISIAIATIAVGGFAACEPLEEAADEKPEELAIVPVTADEEEIRLDSANYRRDFSLLQDTWAVMTPEHRQQVCVEFIADSSGAEYDFEYGYEDDIDSRAFFDFFVGKCV